MVRLLLLVCALSGVYPLSGQSVDSSRVAGEIVMVQPVLDEAATSYLGKLSRRLHGWQYANSRLLVDHLAAGGQATGTILGYGEDRYVVFPSYMADLASAVDVILTPHETPITLRNSEILAVNHSLQLAVAWLPPDFSHEAKYDMEALPPAQATKGWALGFFVTQIPELWMSGEVALAWATDTVGLDVAIDPDAAGGPLVDQEGNLLGITTWQPQLGKQSGSAVSRAAVAMWIAGLRRSPFQATQRQLVTDIEHFCQRLSADWKGMMPFIADEALLTYPVKQVPSILTALPDSMRREVLAAHSRGQALEATRLTLVAALALCNESAPFALHTLPFDSYAQRQSGVVLNSGADSLLTGWVPEKGAWRLAAIPLPIPEEVEKKVAQANDTLPPEQRDSIKRATAARGRGIPLFKPYDFRVMAYTSIPFNRRLDRMEWGILAGYAPARFIFVEMSFYYGQTEITYYGQEPGNQWMMTRMCSYLGFDPSVGGQLPIQVANGVCLTPFVRGIIFNQFILEKDPSFGSRPRRTLYGLGTGLEYAHKIRRQWHFLVGGEWRLHWGRSTLETIPRLSQSVSVRIGVGF